MDKEIKKRGRKKKGDIEQQKYDLIKDKSEKRNELPLTRQVEMHCDNNAENIGMPSINEVTSTGADLMDLIAGGGYPWGKMVNIIGDKSTGKTLLCSELIACARQVLGSKLKWFYDDAEAGYSFDSKQLYGIDIVAEDGDCSETLEDFQLRLDKCLNNLKDNEYLIYVLDSFDSLTSADEIEHYEKKMAAYEKGKKPEAGTYGTSKAKGMSAFFRIMRRKIKDKKCLLIIVSQVRENIGVMFGAKYTRTGGKALDFYAAQTYWLAETQKREKSDRIIGVTIKIRNTKNKTGKPFRDGFIDLLFDYGIDNVSTNLAFLYDLKTETGKDIGTIHTIKLKWDDKEFNLKQLIRHIEQNNLEGELLTRIQNKWSEIETKASTLDGRKMKWGL